MALRVPEPIWRLIYNGADITANISPFATEVHWMERLGGEAAEISVTLEDTQRKWMTSSYPSPQDIIELSIGYAGAPLLDCGAFMLDQLEFDGPPDRVTLRGIESWTQTPLRTPRNVAYEGMTFSQIAQAVAQRHQWQCVNLPTTPDAPWARRTQTLEHGGDINFLRMMANEANYEFTVKPPKLIFYSRPAIDAQAPANTITRSMVTRYSFRFQTAAEVTYGSSTVSYFDPHTKSLVTAAAKVLSKAPTADDLNVVERVENAQQAALKASSRLAEHDMLQYQGTIVMPGTIAFRAGQTVWLPPSDWGVFGVQWTVSHAKHRMRAKGGYTTELLLRQGSPGLAVTPGNSA